MRGLASYTFRFKVARPFTNAHILTHVSYDVTVTSGKMEGWEKNRLHLGSSF